jgi:hypothetical protein
MPKLYILWYKVIIAFAHRSLTKKHNPCHAVIFHENALSMFQASALTRGTHPSECLPFSIFSGGECL